MNAFIMEVFIGPIKIISIPDGCMEGSNPPRSHSLPDLDMKTGYSVNTGFFVNFGET